LARHLVHGHVDADDVAQETFVRAHQALARFDGRSEFYTWLYRIAVNLSLNRARAHNVRRSVTIEDPTVEAVLAQGNIGDLETELETRRVTAALLEEIDALPEALRATMVMVCIEKIPEDTAAEVLGCSPGTVAWRVHEARRKLRLALAERGLDSALDALAGGRAQLRPVSGTAQRRQGGRSS
jgi:RNA polymerase sigma-70 factor, ECF subfamily